VIPGTPEKCTVPAHGIATDALVIYRGFCWPFKRRWTRIERFAVERSHVRVSSCIIYGDMVHFSDYHRIRLIFQCLFGFSAWVMDRA